MVMTIIDSAPPLTGGAHRSIVLSQPYDGPDQLSPHGSGGASLVTKSVTGRWSDGTTNVFLSVEPRQYIDATTSTCTSSFRFEGSRHNQLPRSFAIIPPKLRAQIQFGYDSDGTGQSIGELASITTPWGATTTII